MKSIQYFTDDYLEQCSKMTPGQIVKFLDDFRIMYFEVKAQKSKLISIKIPENLLESFRVKSKLNDVPYQTQIKRLMKDWLYK